MVLLTLIFYIIPLLFVFFAPLTSSLRSPLFPFTHPISCISQTLPRSILLLLLLLDRLRALFSPIHVPEPVVELIVALPVRVDSVAFP